MLMTLMLAQHCWEACVHASELYVMFWLSNSTSKFWRWY